MIPYGKTLTFTNKCWSITYHDVFIMCPAGFRDRHVRQHNTSSEHTVLSCRPSMLLPEREPKKLTHPKQRMVQYMQTLAWFTELVCNYHINKGEKWSPQHRSPQHRPTPQPGDESSCAVVPENRKTSICVNDWLAELQLCKAITIRRILWEDCQLASDSSFSLSVYTGSFTARGWTDWILKSAGAKSSESKDLTKRLFTLSPILAFTYKIGQSSIPFQILWFSSSLEICNDANNDL